MVHSHLFVLSMKDQAGAMGAKNGGRHIPSHNKLDMEQLTSGRETMKLSRIPAKYDNNC